MNEHLRNKAVRALLRPKTDNILSGLGWVITDGIRVWLGSYRLLVEIVKGTKQNAKSIVKLWFIFVCFIYYITFLCIERIEIERVARVMRHAHFGTLMIGMLRGMLML